MSCVFSSSYLKSKALRHTLPGAFHCMDEMSLQLQEILEAFLTCLLVRRGQIVGRVLDQERAVEVPLDGMFLTHSPVTWLYWLAL